MKDATFSPKVVAVLVGGAICLFALSILLHAYQPPQATSGRAATRSSYSVSAVGHAALYDFLERMNRPVQRSSSQTLSQTGSQGVLLMVEPDLRYLDEEARGKLTQARKLLVVLPKWRGYPSRVKPSWVAEVAPASMGEPTQVLGLVTVQAEVARVPWPDAWKTNTLAVTPSGTEVAQVIRSKKLTPLVGDAEGMLLGELKEGRRTIWILSDPDVLANHGLFKGENAAFMLALMDLVRGTRSAHGAPLVFDETVHGYRQSTRSPLAMVIQFPYTVVVLLACLAGLMLFLAAAGRFGTPLRPKPPLDFGKRTLIANGARLLDYAGHHAHLLRRYVRMTIRSTAVALHAPTGMSENETLAWLEKVGKARGVTRSCSAILAASRSLGDQNDTDLARLFACAREIHLWKGEIDHGSKPNRLNRQQNSR